MNRVEKVVQEIKSAHQELGEVLERINETGSNVKDSDVRIIKQTAGVMFEKAAILYGIKEYETLISNLELQLSETKSKIIALEEEAESVQKTLTEDKLQQNEVAPVAEIVPEQEIFEEEVEEIPTPEVIAEEPEQLAEEIPAKDSVEATVTNEEEAVKQLETEIGDVISNFSADQKTEAKPEKGTLWYDKFTTSKTDDNSLAGQYSKQKINDINTHIGINEKFLFTNELFKGDTENFVQELNKLNSFSSSVEALAHFVKLSSKYEWTAENKAYIQLKELVERRYLNQ